MKRINFLILLLTIITNNVIGQELIVSGKITEGSGEPLTGATVTVKGTSIGTTADFEGNYRIRAKKDAIIIFSYIGFQTKELKATGAILNASLESGELLSEVQIVGSRNAKRSVVDSPVPVDIIDVAEIATKNGSVEITQILQYAAPSFNATKQSGSDGADHIVPASLRGLGPDQTLVLINGKRRHQSSLVNIFGTRGRGNSGTDLNAIPAAAIKRIEVLRDGASAQYGSDAIAGVINIVLKDNTDGITGGITYGAYSTKVGGDFAQKIFDTQDEWDPELFNIDGKNRLDGKDKRFDGETIKLDLNYGVAIGEKGFINFTTELLSKDKTLRPSFDWRKGYGSAALDGFNFIINSVIPINDATEVYAFGGRNYRDTNANAFSRYEYDDAPDGELRTVASLYPNGFTPQITSNIIDVSVSAGIKHLMENGWEVDFNNTFGKNNFQYFIKNTNNASLKDATPVDFDAGGHSLSQNTTGVGINKYFEETAKGLNLAFGMEFRTENFEIFSGEEASYAVYDNNGLAVTNPAIQTVATSPNGNDLPGGSQGFPGYSPDNEVNRGRTNVGIYGDAELNITDEFLTAFALRYENYSDFGSTFNFKLASRVNISDALSLRGSVSSGFRAPSLAQLYYNLIFTNIVGGSSLTSLLSANNSTVTKAFGINQLTEEKALNGSIGFTYKKGSFTATIDAYSISVDDRIILTDNFDASGLGISGVEAAQFFANGVDTQTQGVDIVLNYSAFLSSNDKLNVGLTGNLNKLKIDKINNGSLNEYTFFGPFAQAYLKAAAPDYKFGLILGYTHNKFSFNTVLTQFSEVKIQDFQWVDSPATNLAEANELYTKATDIYKKAMIVDLSVSYEFSDAISFSIGGNNIFNTYATPQFDGWTDQGGFADSVQMGSDGAYFFGRLNFKL